VKLRIQYRLLDKTRKKQKNKKKKKKKKTKTKKNNTKPATRGKEKSKLWKALIRRLHI